MTRLLFSGRSPLSVDTAASLDDSDNESYHGQSGVSYNIYIPNLGNEYRKTWNYLADFFFPDFYPRYREHNDTFESVKLIVF